MRDGLSKLKNFNHPFMECLTVIQYYRLCFQTTRHHLSRQFTDLSAIDRFFTDC